jgi:hypothetical protein
MLVKLERIHRNITNNIWTIRFTMLNRLLLAGAFIPTGLLKVLGKPFTIMSPETEVGRFFSVFFENQLWYQAVGWVQVLAGVLLLFPKMAHLGAFLFLPVIVNINFVTIGVGFKGTPVITVAMLFSNLWLIAWAFPHWKSWFEHSVTDTASYQTLHKVERIGVLVGALGAFGILFATRGLFFSRLLTPSLVLIVVGGLVAVAGLILAKRGKS